MTARSTVVNKARWSEPKFSLRTSHLKPFLRSDQFAHAKSIVVGLVPVENLVGTPFGETSLKLADPQIESS